MASQLVPKTINDEIQVSQQWNMFTAAKDRLASRLTSTPSILNRLARRVNPSVQQPVAENSGTDSDTLELLSQHQSSDVRSAVAQNENSLRTTVDSLASDSNCDVRYAMAENPWTNAILLERLAQDENPYVQNRAQRTQAQLRADEAYSTDLGMT